jgi:hypothetical protein
MASYTTEGWSDFLVASAGASAALAGLVFIGISINLTRILAFPGLPARAAQTIVLLATALAVSLTVLSPVDSHITVGLELLGLGLAGWVGVMLIQRHTGVDARGRRNRLRAILLLQVALVPFLVGGVTMVIQAGGGLYWMQAGLILSMLVGLANGWVLLVEILR